MLFHTYSNGQGYPEHTNGIGTTGPRFGGGHANNYNLGWSQANSNQNNMFPTTFGIMDHRANPMVQTRSNAARYNLLGPYGTSGDSNIAPTTYCIRSEC